MSKPKLKAPKLVPVRPADIFIGIMREQREQRGWSAEELAVRLNLHPHVIREWEEGKRTPRLCSAMVWAQTFGLQFELVRS
jgi:ribosome-binding protein aMBF1 (putative translation factor)